MPQLKRRCQDLVKGERNESVKASDSEVLSAMFERSFRS